MTERDDKAYSIEFKGANGALKVGISVQIFPPDADVTHIKNAIYSQQTNDKGRILNVVLEQQGVYQYVTNDSEVPGGLIFAGSNDVIYFDPTHLNNIVSSHQYKGFLTTVPSPYLSREGDMFISALDLNLYVFVGGTWSPTVYPQISVGTADPVLDSPSLSPLGPNFNTLNGNLVFVGCLYINTTSHTLWYFDGSMFVNLSLGGGGGGGSPMVEIIETATLFPTTLVQPVKGTFASDFSSGILTYSNGTFAMPFPLPIPAGYDCWVTEVVAELDGLQTSGTAPARLQISHSGTRPGESFTSSNVQPAGSVTNVRASATFFNNPGDGACAFTITSFGVTNDGASGQLTIRVHSRPYKFPTVSAKTQAF